MSILIAEHVGVSGGMLTVYENGGYRFWEKISPRTFRVRAYYEPNTGPEHLQVRVRSVVEEHFRRHPERVHERAVEERYAEGMRATDRRLREIEEDNRSLQRRLARRTTGEADYRSGRERARPLRTPGRRNPVPNCRTDRGTPINGRMIINTGEVPSDTRNCFFTPLYLFSGRSIRVRFHAVNPPEGDWSVQMFSCYEPVNPRDPCNNTRRVMRNGREITVTGTGILSQPGRSISEDVVFNYNPQFWDSRKFYFRIRNGANQQAISNVQITFEPQFRDPILEALHTALSVAGLIPIFGIIPDGVNCIIYLLEEDWVNAGFSGLSMVPGFFGESAGVYQLNELRGYHVIRALRSEINEIGPEVIARRLNHARRVESGRAGRQRGSSRETDALADDVDRNLLNNVEAGELRSHGRMRRARSTDLVPSFDTLNLTDAERRAVRLISGQSFRSRLHDFRDAWQHIIDNNARAQREMDEIRQLFAADGVTDPAIRAARQADARRLGRQAYNRARVRFWRYVRRTDSLRDQLTDAGLHFSGSRGSAPYWRFSDGYRERLTIEHMNRVTDAPWSAIDANNMQFVPFRENVNTLEWIRNLPDFQNSATGQARR